MAYKAQFYPLTRDILHLANGFLLKLGISHGQNLIDNQILVLKAATAKAKRTYILLL
jgi:hypothetical protein